MSSSKILINDKLVTNEGPTYFIADIAANHDGDLTRAKELIYLAAEAGADAAKFQHFEASSIVNDKAFKNMGTQLSHQESWKKTVYEVYEDATVDLNWTKELKETCDKAGIPFFTTPYYLDVVDYMDEFVPAYKIGSGDITWPQMIKKVASMGKPYVMASGASSFDEVVRAVDLALSINPSLCLMQCNTNYTASLENFRFIQLNVLKCYRNMYPELLLGLSDHTPGHSTVLGAIALGARMIEKHFTDDTSRVGPDHKFSMDPASWKEMVDRTRELEYALGTGIKRVENNEKETIIVQRRGMFAARKIMAGESINADDFIAVRPCDPNQIDPFEFEKIVGCKLVESLDVNDPLTKTQIAHS